MELDDRATVWLSFRSSASVRLIATGGLAGTVGLMGTINFAHGEFSPMSGAYAALLASWAGIPCPIAGVLAGVSSALFGAAAERVMIRHRVNLGPGVTMRMAQVFDGLSVK